MREIDKIIRDHVATVMAQDGLPDLPFDCATDSIAEVIEKLIILHIRNWMLEDAVADAKTDAALADLKRKLDWCFKVRRPRLVEALNAMLDRAIREGRSLAEESVKIYRG